ncbi:MAG: amidohydrolase family protein [Planctomycetota bacterium]|nr:amidohydrolase family protein [Planctomycetota bacterium]MEC7679229.1 amidohydrolase family protein [Planctomycetota bacterium]
MMKEDFRVIRARWIVPVSSPPFQNGWIRYGTTKIQEIGSGEPPADAVDLGDVAILPRLINSHTHLEFSDHESPVGSPGVSFSEWIKLVIASRRLSNPDSLLSSLTSGLNELWETGTVLAGDIATPPLHYPAWKDQPDLVSFAEVLGLQSDRFKDRFQAAIEHADRLEKGAYSPHAPYSISRDGFEKVIEQALVKNRPVAMHIAESPEERELLTSGTGPLAELLDTMNLAPLEHYPWRGEPFRVLIDGLGQLDSGFLIHGNDLTADEIEYLTRYPQLTVVYCPRTHDFFRFAKHPVDKMVKAGIRVALGTDSRASNPDLNLWKEVQYLLNHRQEIPPEEILAMATSVPADAFQRAWPSLRPSGQLRAGFRSDFGVVETYATESEQLWRDLSTHPYCIPALI